MSQISVGNDVKMNNGVVVATRIVTGNTTITNTSGNGGGHDFTLAVDLTSGSITVSLPTTSGNGMEAGRKYYICDYKGLATSTEKIIIDPGGSATVSGQSTFEITNAYNSVMVQYITTNTWMVV